MITCSEFRELWLKKDGIRMVDPVNHVVHCKACQMWLGSETGSDPDEFQDSGFLETDIGDTPIIVDEPGG